MNYKTFFIIILIFIIIDISTINHIWGENFHRRSLHHIQRGQFNPNKTPVIHFLDKKLDKNVIDYALNIKYDNDKQCLQKISVNLNKLAGGSYSNKCFLYYNDFDKETQQQLDEIGESMIPYLEKLSKNKLYLGNSDFRCVLLKYEGKDAEFIRHYDTEPASCYRTLFLINKEGNPPPFIYYDKNGKKQLVDFDVGEGLFFKGTQTYHGVEKTKDPNMKRYMLGWQYTTDPDQEDISFCSKMRGVSSTKLVKMLLPHILFLVVICLLILRLSKSSFKLSHKLLLIVTTIITFIIGAFLPRLLVNTNIGTGLTLNIRSFLVFLIVSIISCGNIYVGMIFFNYIILTEIFLPRQIIGKKLKIVENI
jgi:hypothetical protein